MTGKIISPETARTFSRRSRIERREWRERRNGSAGAASPVRHIHPITFQPVEVIELSAANLSAGAPKLTEYRAWEAPEGRRRRPARVAMHRAALRADPKLDQLRGRLP